MIDHKNHKVPIMSFTRLWFSAIFLLLIMVDQATKQVMLDLIFEPPRRIEILAILNLVPVWNRGMSFGMLADGGAFVPVGLTGLAVAVSAWLFWMVPRLIRVQRLSAAFIAGGAIGNALDRLRFGMVVDFIDLHYAGWHWPAFNLADAAITLGAVLWGYSILRGQEISQI
ncbi:MAG: signal peptidase II [Pseudomonadota bacterium]|nr:signal peptidase II [Pseudomonadota bacterium]